MLCVSFDHDSQPSLRDLSIAIQQSGVQRRDFSNVGYQCRIRLSRWLQALVHNMDEDFSTDLIQIVLHSIVQWCFAQDLSPLEQSLSWMLTCQGYELACRPSLLNLH